MLEHAPVPVDLVYIIGRIRSPALLISEVPE